MLIIIQSLSQAEKYKQIHFGKRSIPYNLGIDWFDILLLINGGDAYRSLLLQFPRVDAGWLE